MSTPARRASNGDIIANYEVANGQPQPPASGIPAVLNSITGLLASVTNPRRGLGIVDGLGQLNARGHARDTINQLEWVDATLEAGNKVQSTARSGALARLRDENEALRLVNDQMQLQEQIKQRSPLTRQRIAEVVEQQDLELDARIELARGKARKRLTFLAELDDALIEAEVRMRRLRRTDQEIATELAEVEKDFYRSWGYQNGGTNGR